MDFSRFTGFVKAQKAFEKKMVDDGWQMVIPLVGPYWGRMIWVKKQDDGTYLVYSREEEEKKCSNES